MADPFILDRLFVQVARLGLSGRSQDVQGYLRKTMRSLSAHAPELALQISDLLVASPTGDSPLRDAGASFVPVDADSRMALIKHELPGMAEAEPMLEATIRAKLDQVIRERANATPLERQGLAPTRSLLFVGPPGVGKTMSARWLAHELGRPLLTLDLATVMSSYLGKTGSNIRAVLDYAKSVKCVLLLDEFDAIAKRRDDDGDVGELKRLVTVLLQEVDDWPSSNLLIAATNHGELLDPAIWRRFDDVVYFPQPSKEFIKDTIRASFSGQKDEADPWVNILSHLWSGKSFSDITRSVNWIRRRSAVTDYSISEAIVELLQGELSRAPLSTRKEAAAILENESLSDRRIQAVTGLSRDTLRKYRQKNDRIG